MPRAFHPAPPSEVGHRENFSETESIATPTAQHQWNTTVPSVESLKVEEEMAISRLLSERIIQYLDPETLESAPQDLIENLHYLWKHLSNDTSPFRIQLLLFAATHGALLPAIFRFLKISTADTQVKIEILKTVILIIGLCAADDMSHGDQADVNEARIHLAQQLCTAFLKGDCIRLLFQLVVWEDRKNDEIKLLSIESIFVFFARNPFGVDAVVQSGGIQYSFRCLATSADLIIRNYSALMLKDISEKHFVEVMKNLGEWGLRMVTVICDDSSSDVRSLLAQMLRTVFRKVPSAFAGFPLKTQLAQSIRKCLDTENNFGVLRSIFTLLETLFVIEASVSPEDPLFIVSCLHCLIHAKLVQSVSLPEQISSLAARTLRNFIQFCPPSEMIGRSMITDFSMWRPIASVLIGSEHAHEQSDRCPTEPSIHGKQMQRIRDVECSVAMSLLLSIDPMARRAMQSHFSQKKKWMKPLRRILIAHLQEAGEQFYKDIMVVDCTGRLINDVEKVRWVYKRKREASLEQPETESLQLIFISQEQRVHIHSMATFAGSPLLFAPGRSNLDDDPFRTSRLTLCVLRLGVVMALPDESRIQPGLTESELAWVSDGSLSDKRHWMVGSSTSPESESQSESVVESSRGKDEDVYPVLDENKRFDNVILLILQFTLYYTKKSELLPPYHLFSETHKLRKRHEKRSPWNLPPNTNKLRKWTMDDVQATYLFDFDVPFRDLDEYNAELWLNRARKHFVKALLQTPQREKGTRWFLYDMLHNAMPPIQDLFATIVALLQKNGTQEVKFAITMFRAREIQKGETSIHPGNIIDIVDQIQYYFAGNETVPERVETSERFRSLEDAIRKLKMNDALQKEESDDELNDGLLEDDEEETNAIARARKHLASHGSSPLSRNMSSEDTEEPDIDEEIAKIAGKRALQYENVEGEYRRKPGYVSPAQRIETFVPSVSSTPSVSAEVRSSTVGGDNPPPAQEPPKITPSEVKAPDDQKAPEDKSQAGDGENPPPSQETPEISPSEVKAPDDQKAPDDKSQAGDVENPPPSQETPEISPSEVKAPDDQKEPEDKGPPSDPPKEGDASSPKEEAPSEAEVPKAE